MSSSPRAATAAAGGLAAKVLRQPLLVFLPDVEAGMAVKTSRDRRPRVRDRTRPSKPCRDKATVTGYPSGASSSRLRAAAR
jgi:hypothetical protein